MTGSGQLKSDLKVSRETIEGKVYFIVSGLDRAYYGAVKGLNFQETENGFARIFPATTPSLDRIYQSFALHAEEMILQAAGALQPHWESALAHFIERTKRENVDWWLTGSAALAIREVGIVPRDIDLVTTGSDAQRLGNLLSDWLVEPVQQAEGWVAKWFGRAYHHSRIEWVGDVEASVDRTAPTDLGPTAAEKLEVVHWRGHEIRVPPLELQLKVSERRGLNERANKIREIIGTIH